MEEAHVCCRRAHIPDTDLTPANVHDNIVYLERLDRQRERFGFDVGAVGLDAGYATTDRNGYKHYRSDPSVCREWPLLASCTSNVKAERTITRHVWVDARERTDAHRKTPWGKAVYKRRRETVERSFADAKQLHGHRYARFRSLINVRWQCLLAASAQNIKKIAMAMTKATRPAWG